MLSHGWLLRQCTCLFILHWSGWRQHRMRHWIKCRGFSIHILTTVSSIYKDWFFHWLTDIIITLIKIDDDIFVNFVLFYRGGRGDAYQRVARIVTFVWKHTFARIGEDWVFLGLLGVIMALVSFLMDYTISMCNNARLWLVKDLVSNIYLQFVAWVLKVFQNIFNLWQYHVYNFHILSKISAGFSSRIPCSVFNRICACCSSPGNS